MYSFLISSVFAWNRYLGGGENLVYYDGSFHFIRKENWYQFKLFCCFLLLAPLVETTAVSRDCHSSPSKKGFPPPLTTMISKPLSHKGHIFKTEQMIFKVNNEIWGIKIPLGVSIIGIKVSGGRQTTWIARKRNKVSTSKRRNLVKSNKVCPFGD